MIFNSRLFTVSKGPPHPAGRSHCPNPMMMMSGPGMKTGTHANAHDALLRVKDVVWRRRGGGKKRSSYN